VTGATRVWWLDPVRQEVVYSVEVEQPGPIVVRPDGVVLYVGSLREREPFRIVAISTDRRQVDPFADVPGIPTHLALSPDGRRLWVAHGRACAAVGSCVGSSGISVVDVPTGRVVATFTQEAQGIVGPAGLVVPPNGDKAYYTDVSTSSVGVIDTRSLTVLDPIPSFCCLESAIAVSPDGMSLYALGNEFGGFIVTIDTATDTVRQSSFLIGQNAERGIDFEHDIEIGKDNGTAYLAGSICTQPTCEGHLLFFDTVRGVLEGSLRLASVPVRVALTPGDRLALLALPEDRSVAVVNLADRSIAGRIALGEPVYDIGVSRACVGDCDDSGEVTIDEVIVGVRIALGMAEIHACRSFDQDGNARVTIDELIAGVKSALDGC